MKLSKLCCPIPILGDVGLLKLITRQLALIIARSALRNMAPSAIEIEVPFSSKPQKQKSLQLSGVLDQYDSFDTTPVIGREFPTANLVEWLEAPNSDELIRDLAIIST